MRSGPRNGAARIARDIAKDRGWSQLLPAGLCGLTLLVSCCDDSPGPPAPSHGYASRTDGRGWAVSENGLYGHRRVEEAPKSPLDGMGYAQGSEAAPPQTGVQIQIADRMSPGLNLMNSGDAAEAVLMTSAGVVEHRWSLPYDTIPGAPPLKTAFQIPWRRVHLLEDGSLLAIHSDAAMVYLDVDSQLRWVSYGRFHHALDVVEEETGLAIYTLSRTERVVPAVNPDEAILDDLVVRLDADGNETLSVSLWDAFAASPWAPVLSRLSQPTGDAMHANSIVILDAAEAAMFNDSAVRAGMALICMRDLDLVTVVNLEQPNIVWMTGGPVASFWRGLHDPSLTAGGELLVFDNLGGHGGNSRLLRVPLQLLDGEPPSSPPATWTWKGDPSESFSTAFCGIAQELPGGNVLATESCHGRVIEIDPATGDVVWEYVSERVAGEDNELIAALFEVRRVPRPAWLSR